jgi:hypothetical protein
MVLGFQLMDSYSLGRCSSSWATPQPHCFLILYSSLLVVQLVCHNTEKEWTQWLCVRFSNEGILWWSIGLMTNR